MLIEARDLRKSFRLADGSRVEALAGVSLEVAAGEAVGVVGPSGSGKSTLGRLLLGLERPDAGGVSLDGEDLASLRGERRRRARRLLQPVAQDPGSALDPRQRVDAAIAEPLRAHRLAAGPEVPVRVAALLGAVGLDAGLGRRFPHELSGGERQRVALARALAVQPALLVADEPLAHLDPAARAEILDLLLELRRTRNLALILIGHDLPAVAGACSRLLVVSAGRIVEQGPSRQVLSSPAHPCTCELVGSW